MIISVDEGVERLIVAFESFLSLGIALVSSITGAHIPPLSTPAICHLYGSDTPTTEFFLETNITVEDDVCVASDWIVLLFQFLVLHVIRWWLRWLVCEPMARRYMGRTTTSQAKNGGKRRVHELAQTMVAMLFRVVSAWCAWCILFKKEWLHNSQQWSIQEDPTVSPDLKFYYLLYVARSLSDTVSLCLSQTTNSDAWVYVLQHVVSVALILGSAMSGYIRIGCVLIILMDWSEPLLLLTKMVRYVSSSANNGNRLLDMIALVVFLIRNIMLSFVVWTCVQDFPKEERTLKALSIVLVLLQTYWFASTVRTTLNRYSNKGNVDVIQSEAVDENEDLDELGATKIARRKKLKKR